MNDYRIITGDATSTAGDQSVGSTDYDMTLPTRYSNYIETYVKLQNVIDEIYYEIIKNPGLLYKNWLTEKEWIRELYIASVYKKLKAYSGYHKIITILRTVKATSPIRRNRPYGRK